MTLPVVAFCIASFMAGTCFGFLVAAIIAQGKIDNAP